MRGVLKVELPLSALAVAYAHRLKYCGSLFFGHLSLSVFSLSDGGSEHVRWWKMGRVISRGMEVNCARARLALYFHGPGALSAEYEGVEVLMRSLPLDQLIPSLLQSQHHGDASASRALGWDIQISREEYDTISKLFQGTKGTMRGKEGRARGLLKAIINSDESEPKCP